MSSGALPARARVLLVLACLATLVPVAVFVPDPGTPVWIRVLAAVLVVAQAAALWCMSAAPGRATAVVITAGAAIQVMQPVLGFGIAVVALSTLAWLRPPRTSLWALGAVLALTVVDGLLARPWSEALLWAAGAALAWTWGELGRVTGARRRAETRKAILEERARIARELHDVLAHTVSVMVVQAGAADDVFDSSPERARAAVRAVETTGRQAQLELRQLLRTVAPDEDARADPNPVWPISVGSPQRSSRRGWPCGPTSSRAQPRRRRVCSCRPTGSCRNRSPTRCATPARRVPGSRSGSSTRNCSSTSVMTSVMTAVVRSGTRGRVGASSGCGSGRSCSAGRCRPVRTRRAAGASRRGCR